MQGVGGMGLTYRTHHLLVEATLNIYIANTLMAFRAGRRELPFLKSPLGTEVQVLTIRAVQSSPNKVISRAPVACPTTLWVQVSHQGHISQVSEESRWHMNAYHLFKFIWNIHVCVHMLRCTYGGLRTTLDVRFHLPPCLRHALLLSAASTPSQLALKIPRILLSLSPQFLWRNYTGIRHMLLCPVWSGDQT